MVLIIYTEQVPTPSVDLWKMEGLDGCNVSRLLENQL